MSLYVAQGAPVNHWSPYWRMPITYRRLEVSRACEGSGAVAAAQSALIELGREDLSLGIYANRIGAPSYRPGMGSLDTPEEIAIVTKAFFIGHLWAEHIAWMHNGGIVCVTCEAKSEELAAQM